MTDVVDEKTRSRMMSGIRGKNTRPELTVRSLLHRQGFRFRIHVGNLAGKPDIVLKRYRAVIFVHGCFWHGHKNCQLFKWPKSREDFWKNKISGNIGKDRESIQLLQAAGWRVCIVWECAIKGSGKNPDGVAEQIKNWLKGECDFMEISG